MRKVTVVYKTRNRFSEVIAAFENKKEAEFFCANMEIKKQSYGYFIDTVPTNVEQKDWYKFE